MSRRNSKFYLLTIHEIGELRRLPAPSDSIARDLARQRLAEDHWLLGDFSLQRESYDATEWKNDVVMLNRGGRVIATLMKG